MAFEGLSKNDQEIILRCMKATDAYVPDDEKHARLGLDRGELRSIIAQWPHIDDSNVGGNGFLAINNCLNEVCHGFHLQPAEWSKWFDKSKADVDTTYRKWRSLRGVTGGIR